MRDTDVQAVDLKELKIGDFVGFVDIDPPIAPVAPSNEPAEWYVVQTEPQQDLTTVWRLHELGLEMFVPVLRRRVKTGRIGKNGHKVTRVIAKPMFPGYGFLRTTGIGDHRTIEEVRGVSGFMRDIAGNPVKLPHAAVLAVFRKQMEEQQKWIQENGGRRGSAWKRGDRVRVDDDGGAYAGLIATIDKIDSKGRIEVLLGMIRTSLPADMVVAA
ncbi:Transcription antitermination factor NusG [Bradyrhizobium lablabi]|uniref:Transcription antitermination factor NusG n=2 Tax=Bradyrhizobium lablabi TaxID=722472 RepID=A0A1M6LIL1_9BRAD|nr:Transcription antitermination factor NusG [Bradyrhizobium lablabi]